MPPKKNELAKTTLIGRLVDCADPPPFDEARLATASKNWLVGEAARRGLLSSDEETASVERDNIVIKRYLRTVLDERDDARILWSLDEYVKMASKVRCAGSQLLNLFAIKAFDEGWLGDDGLARWFPAEASAEASAEAGDDAGADEADDAEHDEEGEGGAAGSSSRRRRPAPAPRPKGFIERTLLDQTFVKYALLPFKASLTETEDGMPAALRPVWDEHAAVLLPTYPSVAELRRMAWDQALGDMAREMNGAVKAHVMTHLGDRVRAHIVDVFVHDLGGSLSTARGRKVGRLGGDTFWLADLYEELETGRERPGVPAAVREVVARLRQRLGLEGNRRLSKMKRLTDDVFKLHVELSRVAEMRLRAFHDQAPPPDGAGGSDDAQNEASASGPGPGVARGAVARGAVARGDEDEEPDPRMCRPGAKPFSACPVVKTHRTFAYLDQRVLDGLIAGFDVPNSWRRRGAPEGAAPLAVVLGVDEASWNAASKRARRLRRTRRKRAYARGGRATPRPRRHDGQRGRADPGVGKFPKGGWAVTSASTDGVAVCATLARPAASMPPAPVDADGKLIVVEKKVALDPEAQRIASDNGRVVLTETAQRTPDGGWVHLNLTRKDYRRRSGQLRREAQEAERRAARPALRAALESLSHETWKTTTQARFKAMVDVHAAAHGELEAEYVTDAWYARWRMLLWRKKRATIMQRVAAIVQYVAPKPSDPKHRLRTKVVLGVGNAKFASTGRGEVAVPTTSLAKTMARTARCLSRSYDVAVIEVPEWRTTMCCHGCQQLLRNVRDADGRVLRGLKRCVTPGCRRGVGHHHEVTAEAAPGGRPIGAHCEGCGACAAALRDEEGQQVRGLTQL
jgi:hypothetical protein